MNTIIEKIRAEIEQMLHSIENCPFISGELGAREKEMGEVMAYKNILSFLSDLEKSEKPINPVLKDFPTTEKEMQDFLATHERIPVPERLNSLERILQEQPVKTNIVEDLKHYLATTPKEQIEKDWESLKEWGKVGPSVSEFLGWGKPVSEGLEEEITRTYHDGSVADTSDLDHNSYENIARHFAQWGAEHLKK